MSNQKLVIYNTHDESYNLSGASIFHIRISRPRALESQRDRVAAVRPLRDRSRAADCAPNSTITSCTVHRTFQGAKRSTGAGLEQKLVQLTSPGHAPAASPAAVVSSFCQRRRFPIPNERAPDFSFTTKGSQSLGDAMGRKRASGPAMRSSS